MTSSTNPSATPTPDFTEPPLSLEPASLARELGDVAEALSWRITVRRWLRRLDRTVLLAAVACSIAALLSVIGGVPERTVFWVSSILAAWAFGGWVWEWARRPNPREALAAWDDTRGANDQMVSGWCFVAEALTPATQVHLARVSRALPEARRAVPTDLPVRVAGRAWSLPLGLVLVAFLVGALGGATDAPIGANTTPVVAELEESASPLDQLEGLSVDEAKAAEELAERLEGSVEELRSEEDATQESVLRELEQRASEAEALAARLRENAGDRLSSELLTELGRHADTADLAAAVRGQEFENAAGESRQLAGKLRDADLPMESAERIEGAFNAGLEVATPKDLKTRLGDALVKATSRIEEGNRPGSAQEMDRLADEYQRLARRRESEEKLQRLARRLREAGQKMLGRKESLRQLAQGERANSSSALQRLPGSSSTMPNPGASSSSSQGGAQGSSSSSASSANSGSPSSSGLLPPRPSSSRTGGAPVPGTPGSGSKGSNAGSPSGSPGQNAGSPGVPGASGKSGSCSSCSGGGCSSCSGSGQGAGQQGAGKQGSGGQGPPAPQQGTPPPVPGSSGPSQKAGFGTAAYGGSATTPHQGTNTEKVAARPGEGESSMRDVAPQGSSEATQAARREIAIEFVRAEEEALSEEVLPVTRREQIIRYFEALRRQLAAEATSQESED